MYFTANHVLIKEEEHLNDGGVNEWDENGTSPLPKGSYRVDSNVTCYKNKNGSIEQIGLIDHEIILENEWEMTIKDVITSTDGRRVKEFKFVTTD